MTALAAFAPIKRPGTATLGLPLLDPRGPFAVLGWRAETLAAPLSPAADTVFGPRGVCLHPNGALLVTDTGHHRLLGWRTLPASDNAPADILVGQPSFSAEGRNAKGPVTAATLNVPTGVAAWGDGLAVADAWNHRVLLWHELPQTGQPADIVLGQADVEGGLANRGADRPTAATLYWPYGVACDGERVIVCDTGNRRVLIFDAPAKTGAAAEVVLGQKGFERRDENAGGALSAHSMRWPHAAALWEGRLAVADAGNNRVMLWDGWPQTFAPADAILGQDNAEGCDHNGGAYYPTSATLNMPYGLAVAGGRLAVADTANSRLVGFRPNADAAYALTGQDDFSQKGDNRWGLPVRDSLCWPYGLAARDDTLAIADSGNNRVLLWRLAHGG